MQTQIDTFTPMTITGEHLTRMIRSGLDVAGATTLAPEQIEAVRIAFACIVGEPASGILTFAVGDTIVIDDSAEGWDGETATITIVDAACTTHPFEVELHDELRVWVRRVWPVG
jgi:hypothetical protein